jgi:hypothetical protein
MSAIISMFIFAVILICVGAFGLYRAVTNRSIMDPRLATLILIAGSGFIAMVFVASFEVAS